MGLQGSTEHTQAQAPTEERSQRRCPRCHALNAPDAQWCGQCLARFDGDAGFAERRDVAADHVEARRAGHGSTVPPGAAKPVGSVSVGDAFVPGATASPPTNTGAARAFHVGEDGITWTCAICDSENPFELRTCSVCGAPLAAMLREPDAERVERDPGKTAIISLLLPGAGHAYLGLWGQGIARAVTSVWVMFVLMATALEQGFFSATPIVFAVASFGLWAIASHDAYREAQHQPGAVLLKGRSFFYVVLGLIALSIVMIFVTALSLRGA